MRERTALVHESPLQLAQGPGDRRNVEEDRPLTGIDEQTGHERTDETGPAGDQGGWSGFPVGYARKAGRTLAAGR